MKYFITIIALIFYNNLFAQNYLNSNPQWTEYTIGYAFVGTYYTSQEYTIRLEGDTTINNIVYFKTKKEGIITSWDYWADTLVWENSFTDYAFPLREEQGKFYIYNTHKNEEQLLHNFNLSVGDTAISLSCSTPQVVKEIDTVYFGTQMRKKFIFRPEIPFGNTPLYEGIGTSRGLFAGPCSGVIGFECARFLFCYSTDSDTIQIDTMGQCETTTPVNTKNLKKEKINIYPNPFDERIIIENKWQHSDMLKIKLYDFYGNLIKSSSVHSSDNTIEISTKEITSGMYILVICEKNKIYASKMMKK